MIELYAADTANSSKIFIMLEELELPYDPVPVDILAGEQFERRLTQLNLNQKVPVIVDPDGPDGQPHIIFESGAILVYLAERAGRFMPVEPAARSEALQWLMMQMSTVGPMMGQLIHFARFAPEGNDYALSRYRSQVHRFMKVLEQRLETRKWIGGAEYGVVDIANFPWIRAVKWFLSDDVDVRYPRLSNWCARIAERPAVLRADAAKAKLVERFTPPDRADQDKLDRLLGRGPYAHP